MRISNWNFVRVPKATRTKFQLEIITINVISGIVYFREIIVGICETLVKQPPGLSQGNCGKWKELSTVYGDMYLRWYVYFATNIVKNPY